jgi:hypothetical protein
MNGRAVPDLSVIIGETGASLVRTWSDAAE